MVDSQAKCVARGGRWDPVNNRCSIPEGETQGTRIEAPPTTPRELLEQERRNIEGEIGERRRQAEKIEAQRVRNLDKPVTTKIDTITKTASSGDGRTVQNGVPGVIENGVFFADERPLDPQKVIFNESGEAVGLETGGRTLLGLSQADIDAQLQVGAVAADAQQQQDLAGGVGQFGRLGVSPTPFDFGAIGGAATRGIIPGSIGAVGGVIGSGLAGAKGGALAGSVGGVGGAFVLGALGFAAGVAGSILGEMKGQRTDNTNAQQRVLDEGKQILNDWVTFAEANPSQKEFALAGFNQQLALIDQAYRQMKLDTSQDVLAFENAIPNLAEFEAFYSASGERDIYSNEMRVAMTGTESIDVRMIDLFSRRGK